AENLKNLIVDNKNVGVSVYVIGFGLDRESQTTLNQIAEAGGTSKAYFANNVDDLVTILAHDITEDILGGKYARSSPVVTRAPEEGDEYLTRYDAYFDYPTWRGHLEAWNLDENGKIIGKAAHWASNCSGIPPLTGALPGSADAGCIIAEDRVDPGVSPVGPAALDRRTLYANVQDGVNANGDPNYIKVAFNPTEVAALKSLVNPVDLLVPSAQDVNGDGVIGDDQDAIDVINYIHHPGYDLNKYKGNRDPQWPLADIYNSAPVVVTAPVQGECTGPTGSETWDNMAGYCAFKEAYKNRDTMVYVGTNGGMIEAIAAGRPAKAAVLAADGTTVLEALIPEESGGFEKWGYIPNNVLGNLRGLKDGHKFSMDLPLKASNIDTSPGLDGTGWKTILVAGQRRGGNSYTALDITNPDNPQPLWEFTHPDLGQTWSIPEFGRIVINGVGTSVVFFGGGYSLNADVGNRFFIVRASDGLLIKEFTVGSSVNDVPSGLTIKGYPANKIGQLVDYRTNTPLSPSPACAAVNQSLKLKIETVYFGDTSGTVWRLSDLNNFDPPDDIAQPFGPPWSANLTALYTPDADEQMPIYYRPVVQDIRKGTVNCAGDASGCLRRYILVGTGDEQSPTSTADGLGVPQVNYFFEIEDREFDSAIRDVHTPTWTTDQIAAGAFRLNWRINLGFDLPHDQYGFLLAPNGVRLKKGTQDILNLQTYILNWTVFNDPAQGWSIDGNRSLLKFGNVKAIAGTFLIRHNEGSPHDDNALYNDAVGTFKVADDGTYYLRDLSLWITDRDGCFYDTDGTCLVDTDTYQYDNDGWLTNAGAKVIDPRFNRNVSVISVMGEKVLAAPVSQAGNVFFSTYSPAGGCAMGQSFVYGFAISDCSNLGGEGVLEFDEYGRELLTTRTNLHITGFATGVIASGPYLNLTISGSDGTGDAGEVDHQDIGGSTPTEESVDVPSVCGDDSCDGNENFTSCPEDCTDPQIVAPVDAMKLKYWRQD
ncbi:MAG: PilC/PilY family type IV pilus protein, partial [Desulfoprunum sp.]|nr:PilC/PilY family type IV pilus protein [Desulfoprunum sp.]